MPETLLEAALDAVAQGWAVLPLHTPAPGGCSCGRSCGSPGKNPRTRHGVYDASGDVTVLWSWWQRWPEANLGIATGQVSALVVLDVDPRHGGYEALEHLQTRWGVLPASLMAASGGGGWHFYFRAPPAISIRSRANLAGQTGLDVRGDGGFIVAPPSQHASSQRYCWHSAEPLATLPPAWVRLLSAPQQRRPCQTRPLPTCDQALLDRLLAAAVRLAHPGRRNRLGYWLACRLVEAGVEPREAEAIMAHYAGVVGSFDLAPYTEAEALASLRSAYTTLTRHRPCLTNLAPNAVSAYNARRRR